MMRAHAHVHNRERTLRSRRLAAVVSALLLFPAPSDAAAPGAVFAPPAHADAHDAGHGVLDVRSVAFGQVDAHLTLTVRTEASRELGELCVVIARRERVAGRLCATDGRRAPVLRYQPAGGVRRRVDATVSRPDRRTLEAWFGTGAIPLARGAFEWWVEAGTDRVPDSGAFRASLSVLGQPDCFAAAARDVRRPCQNPALRDVLVPRPADALLVPNAPCRVVPRRGGVLTPCEFGVTGPRRRATFALLGDSHAATWRAALEVVAQARRWRGVSITRPGCPFSTQVPASPDLGPAECVRLHRETLRWLRVSGFATVFVSSWAQPPSGPHGGTAGYGGGAAAFGAMLDALPRSVRHVYVLRDNPAASACARTRSCTAARGAVLEPDPAALAARSRGPRVRVIDLTRFFCDRTRCHSAIGGAYVYKDDNHMNSVFSTSLGPFVLRAL